MTALALLLVAPYAFAQTTRGSIEGTVVDQGGAALPGVAVTVSSPRLQGGTRTVLTGKDGAFRIVSLPPGTYEVQFRLEGFQDLDQKGVQVNIAQATPLRVQMASGFTGEIEVTAEHSGVNTTTTETGVNLTSEFFTNLPTGRDYASVARVTPGAQSDGSGQTFYGSTGAENAYYIDGVNTTGIQFGQQGKQLNFEFIDEVQVKSAGYDAEYGRNTGGIINVITKSGGNAFHGDVFGYYDSDSLRANLKADAAAGVVSGAFVIVGRTRQDYGLDLGGYFVKDKLWFFAAYDRVESSARAETIKDFSSVGGAAKSASFSQVIPEDLFAGKITWLLSPRHSISASVFGDPSTVKGPLGSPAGPPTSFLGRGKEGATDYVANYDGVLTDRLMVTARYASHNEKKEPIPLGASLPVYADLTDPLGDGTVVFGWLGLDPNRVGYGSYPVYHFGRDIAHADASYFANDLGGSHEFKLGAEAEDVSVRNAKFHSGGQVITRHCLGETPCPNGPYFYQHNYFVATRIDPYSATLADIVNPQVEDTKAEDQAYFLQDTWRIASNFTADLGVRWDVQKLYNADRKVQAKLDDAWAPRVGFIWDPAKNGRSKIYAHYGLFFETVPMDIVLKSFGGTLSLFARNFSEDPADVAGDPQAPSSFVSGGGFANVDPSTRTQHIEEWIVGGEYEVAPNLAVGLKYIRRHLKDVIEDSLAGNGYYIGNPGKGLMTGTYDIGYAFGVPEAMPLHDLHVPTRAFNGVELTVTKRPTKRFQFISSLLWSKLDGTYDGLFQASTGQLDPNLNSAFDYYDFSVNNTGKLSNDRTWQFKWDGTYQFNFGLTVGLSAHYESGVPITAYGYSAAYQNWEYYLSTRGAFGRTDNTYEADIHFGFPFKLRHGIEVNLLLDVFNLLNRQGETGRDMRYTNRQERFLTPYYVPLNWITGETYTLDPRDPQVTATNAAWNTSNAWQDPRSVRLGARLSW